MKTIFVSESAPGSGKTHALLEFAAQKTQLFQKIVLAVPTRALAKEINSKAIEKGIHTKLVTPSTSSTTSVSSRVEELLHQFGGLLIVVTHAGLLTVPAEALKHSTLIIDETPCPFSFQHSSLAPKESSRILSDTEVVEGTLVIKENCKTEIEVQLSRYRSDATSGKNTSTLNKIEAGVLETLIKGGWILAQRDTATDTLELRCIAVADYSAYIQSASECHMLAAKVLGGLFHRYYQALGFCFERSPIQARSDFRYTCPIVIHPLVIGKRFSKRLVLIDENQDENIKHHGLRTSQSGHQNLDVMVEAAINHTSDRKTLLFANKWVRFDWLKGMENITQCPMDSRGRNDLSDHTDAILVFGGNPSPLDRRCLEHIAQKLELDVSVLVDSWNADRKLDMSLQAATRTSVRNLNNTTTVNLYVQDMETAEYLRDNLPGDTTISLELGDSLKLYKTQTNARKAKEESRTKAYEMWLRSIPAKQAAELLNVSKRTVERLFKNFRDATKSLDISLGKMSPPMEGIEM